MIVIILIIILFVHYSCLFFFILGVETVIFNAVVDSIEKALGGRRSLGLIVPVIILLQK